MKKLLLPVLLLSSEILFYFIIGNIFNAPLMVSIKTFFLYFIYAFSYGHYKTSSTLIWHEIKNNFKAIFMYCITVLVFVTEVHSCKRITLFVCFSILMFIVSVFFNRAIRILFWNYLSKRTLVIGSGKNALKYINISKNNRFSLTNVVALVSVVDNNELIERMKDEESFFRQDLIDNCYSYSELDTVLLRKRVNQIVVMLPDEDNDIAETVMKDIYGKAEHIKFYLDGTGLITFSSMVQDYDGMILVATSRSVMNLFDKTIKRIIDILAGIIGCLLCIPLGILIKLTYLKNGDKDSIIFKQDRIGKYGRTITIYKFRTMIPNAESVLEELMKKDKKLREEYLMNKKLRNDPRITEIGNKLRNSSLDEFPQFINVLKGEMSLVGPRPYLHREKEYMCMYYDSIISCKPGITGMWQANGRSNVGFEDRCKLDDYYYKNWNVSLDFIIIYKTMRIVVNKKGAY